jgi:hypothetical protein
VLAVFIRLKIKNNIYKAPFYGAFLVNKVILKRKEYLFG